MTSQSHCVKCRCVWASCKTLSSNRDTCGSRPMNFWNEVQHILQEMIDEGCRSMTGLMKHRTKEGTFCRETSAQLSGDLVIRVTVNEKHRCLQEHPRLNVAPLSHFQVVEQSHVNNDYITASAMGFKEGRTI